jgi:hypothetical protein
VRSIRLSLLVTGVLVAAFGLNGCTRPEESSTASTSSSPAASPAASPSASPTATGNELVSAKDYLDQAIRESRNRNRRGALEYLDLARTQLITAAASAEDKIRKELEAAGKDLDSVKAMIEKSDKKADAALATLTQKVAKLAGVPSTAAPL